MAFTKRTYLGKGRVLIGPYAQDAAMVFVGNCSQLDTTVEEAEATVEDFTEAGGGEYDSISRITAVNLAMTKWDLSPANLARALRGSTATVATTPVADEAHKGFQGGFIVLNKTPNPAQSMTVADTGSGSYTENTDWRRTTSGIEVIEGGAIADETDLQISYTPLGGDLIQALISAGQKFKLVFEGLNEANEGRPVIIKCHCVRFGAPQNLQWISSEFASMAIAGSVLKDTTITTPGLSKYLTVEMASAA